LPSTNEQPQTEQRIVGTRPVLPSGGAGFSCPHPAAPRIWQRDIQGGGLRRLSWPNGWFMLGIGAAFRLK